MFRVTVEEVQPQPGDQIPDVLVKRFEQTVDQIDMPRLLAAVNYKPRVRKPRGTGADK